MSIKNKILRKVSIVVGILILAGGLWYSKQLANVEVKTEVVEQERVPQVVEVLKIENSLIKEPLKTTGKLKSSKSIDVYAEVGGNLLAGDKPLKKGVFYKKGELLIKIDKTEELLNLEYMKSDFYSQVMKLLPDIESDFPENLVAWNNYVKNFDPKRPITKLPTPKSEKEKYFLVSKNIEYKYLGIKKSAFKLSKYTVYAPFNGVLNSVNINPGALVRTGQKLGTFMSTDNYELEISIPVSSNDLLKIGSKVQVFNDDKSKRWNGKVIRTSKSIDESTQTQLFYVAVSGKGLFQGMYLNASIESKGVPKASKIKRALIDKNNMVRIVNNNIVSSIPVTVYGYIDNMAIVRGIPDDTQLLVSKVTGIYNGMSVRIME